MPTNLWQSLIRLNSTKEKCGAAIAIDTIHCRYRIQRARETEKTPNEFRFLLILLRVSSELNHFIVMRAVVGSNYTISGYTQTTSIRICRTFPSTGNLGGGERIICSASIYRGTGTANVTRAQSTWQHHGNTIRITIHILVLETFDTISLIAAFYKSQFCSLLHRSYLNSCLQLSEMGRFLLNYYQCSYQFLEI